MDILTTNLPLDQLKVLIQESVQKALSDMDKCEIITRQELCKRLSVTVPTILKMERTGKIPYMKIETSVRYDWKAVKAALQQS